MVVDEPIRVDVVLVVHGRMGRTLRPRRFRADTGMTGTPSISGRRCKSISMPRFSTMSIMFKATTTGFPSSRSCKVR